MKPTIKDVAGKSGVSVATVSRILNGLEGYSIETRHRVEQAIRDLGYKPNAVARGLVNRKTRTIGVLLPCVTEKFATTLLQGIEDTAHERGYSVIVCNTQSNGRRTLEYLRVLGEQRVDGILFGSEWMRDEYGIELTAMKVPVVLVSTYSPRFDFPYVKVDDRMAAYGAVKYLIDHGHSRIGLVTGSPEDRIAGMPRIEGWKAALLDAGLEIDESLIAYGDFHFYSAVKAAKDLLGSAQGLTAIFATSDEMALGVLSHAYRAGLRVPDDLSVVGYDDTLDAEMAIPPLTTVHQPIYEMGRRSAEILFQGNTSRESIIMPFSITERESVRKLDG